MDRETSKLYDRFVGLEVEKAQLLVRPSSFSVFDFCNIARELHDEWIHAEARLDVFRDLHAGGFVFDVALENARIKARKARLACGYDPATPRPDEEEGE